MTLLASASSYSPPNIAGYAIVEPLYLGTRTAVYRAVQTTTQRSVVIKMLQRQYPSFGELLQFRNQYTITKHLPIAGIVPPLRLELMGSSYALVMEDFGGVALEKYMQQQSLEVTETLAIALQIADILHDLAQHRVIHKDIKPANILIHPESKAIKLIDFSIASLLPKETQEIQSPNVLEGTLAYLAPEQTGRMNRGVDYRADFYALGVTLYQLLTGTLPFASNDPLELMHSHIAKVPEPVDRVNPGVPAMVAAIVTKLMAKNAEDRYQSARGLKHDLAVCLTQWQATGTVAAFQLGQRDLSDRFLIPEKLYGRETEVQNLLAAFERVAQGNTELMLVAGFSGIGKTAVVNEVHKPIARGARIANVRQQGYFIKGKFDQFNRNIPFSAFVQALRDLMGQLLSESDAQLTQWQTQILAAIGENGQVLIEVIPELEQIIGQQPVVPELSGSAAQNRFNLLFQKFIAVFTTAAHPLVIFLDDLQWADAASLQLLKLLMSDNGYLLMLGAYRDNEVLPTHPFILMVEELKKAQAIVHTITLAPLNLEDTNTLVADTLHCSQELAQPLTEFIDRKTKGNPFFTVQFLKALHETGQIRFNQNYRYWECDITQINALSLTNNVVEFIALQLQKLPLETQQVLKLAACVGNQFDLATLAIVSEQSHTTTATALWNALQEGLILPTSQVYKFFQDTNLTELQHTVNPRYRFLHDRVQQAAYSLIPENQKQATHYQIGKLLWGNFSIAERDNRLFDVVNQINIGKSLLKDEREKTQFAELNLRAGQKAKASTAYEAAKTYSQQGIDLLTDNAWTDAYRLAFDLHFNLAEAALMSSDFQLLEKTIFTLLKFANSTTDQARIYVLQVDQYSLQGQFLEAIQAGLAGLRTLGIDIDRDELNQLAQDEWVAVEGCLQDRSIATLLDLPAATSPEVRAAIELLMILQPPAYIVADFDLYSFATFRAVRLSIEQGNTAESIKAYVSYGFLIGLMHGQYQRGVEFADLALQLSYKLNSQFQQSRVCFLFSYAIQVWAKPIQGAAEMNYQGFLAGLESGEIIHAGYNLYGNILNRLFQGENLTDIAIDIEKFWLIGEKLQHDFLLSMLDACRFFVHSLTQSLEQSEDLVAAEQAWVERSETLKSYTALGTYYILQMHQACLIQGVKPARHYVTEAGKFLGGCAGFTTSAGYYYYGSLILCHDYADLSEAERIEALQQIETNQAQLKIWSESCSENFLHRYLLVEAERSRLANQFPQALDLYDRAIAAAKANGFTHEEALANELAARFYFNWGKEKVAAGYMQAAYYGYAHWGARAKTNDLEQRYPELLYPILQSTQSLNLLETLASIAAPIHSVHNSTATCSSNSPTLNQTLDFAVLLKVYQSLSSTIELDVLMRTLLQTMLETSGADYCALLLCQEEEWQMRAIATLKGVTLHNEPLESSTGIPIKLIQYVKHTQTVVAINDLQTDLPVIEDYLNQYQPKSVLCLPILNQGKLTSLLYLENRFTSGVFTDDRILMLNFLCTQAAISLENARLYQGVQEALQEIRFKETQYRSIFEAVSDGLAINSLETGRLIAANPAYCQLHGYSYDEILKMNPLDLIQPQKQSKFLECLTAIEAKREFSCEATCRKPNGDAFNVEIKSAPFWYNNQLCGLSVIRDVTERKQMELFIQEKNHRLEQAMNELQNTQLQMVQNEKMASLGNLVAGVAHEINNPIGFLNGSITNAREYISDLLGHLALYQQHYSNPVALIQNNAEDIDLEFLNEDLPKLLDSMQGATDRIKSISNSLRTFSRADTEHKVCANLHEGVESALLILKYRLKAHGQRPTIEVIQNYGNLPEIKCFPGQLNQVFMNILANAIDMFDEVAQSATLAELEAKPQRVTIQTELSQQNTVEIRISDNGTGMSEAVKARIFDHLFTTKGVGRGTGLGLAIVRQIVVEKHQGSLEVQSQVGQGTMFLIRLPIDIE